MSDITYGTLKGSRSFGTQPGLAIAKSALAFITQGSFLTRHLGSRSAHFASARVTSPAEQSVSWKEALVAARFGVDASNAGAPSRHSATGQVQGFDMEDDSDVRGSRPGDGTLKPERGKVKLTILRDQPLAPPRALNPNSSGAHFKGELNRTQGSQTVRSGFSVETLRGQATPGNQASAHGGQGLEPAAFAAIGAIPGRALRGTGPAPNSLGKPIGMASAPLLTAMAIGNGVPQASLAPALSIMRQIQSQPDRQRSTQPSLETVGAGGNMAMPNSPHGDSHQAESSSSATTPLQGDVYLDGSLMGRWMARSLATAAGRPSAGGTGFDPRRNAYPTGAMIGG